MEINVHFASLMVIFQAQRIITERCNSVVDGTLITCPVYPGGPLEPKPPKPNVPTTTLRPKTTVTNLKVDFKTTLNTYPCEPNNQSERCIKDLYFERYWTGDYYYAKERCAAYGLQLVSIENRDKWGDVVTGMSKGLIYNYWTSALRDQKTKDFHWGNGCSFGFTNWSAGEPNYIGGGEDCVYIGTSLKWYDVGCGKFELGYICESVECVN